ncbi:MAG: phage antirepressor protein [Bacteroidetes bacterium 4484_276]|nr:MAG: phage antirepressor protein [Bacteroidetes bacterium 4484_276]
MSNIKLFESKQIRAIWNSKDQKWYFAVIDVVEVLTESINPKDYIKKMRRRDEQLNSNWGTICPPLKLKVEMLQG